MLIKKDAIYKIAIAILLIGPLLISSVEVNISILLFLFLFILIDYKKKYSRMLVYIVSPLILILFIAIISSLNYLSNWYDITKDFIFLLKPIIYIMVGYHFVSKIKDRSYIFYIIIYISLIIALIHLYNTIVYLSGGEFDVNDLRSYAGRNNALEIFAIVLLFSKKARLLFSSKLKYKNLIKIIILSSFICYFSRTMTVAVIILFLSINGYLTITRKGLYYMTGFLAAVLIFYAYLFSRTIERDEVGITGFLYKIKNAPAEIFTVEEIDVNNHVNLWDHWRAYEAQMAYNQLKSTPSGIGLIFGKGIGSLVDLGFVVPLNKEGMQYISTLHNGYGFIMFKSGFIGVFAYLLFLIFIYMQVYNKHHLTKAIIISNLLSGIAIYYMFTTLIVTGIYNPRDFGGIILGALLYLGHYNRKNVVDAY